MRHWCIYQQNGYNSLRIEVNVMTAPAINTVFFQKELLLLAMCNVCIMIQSPGI